METHMEDEWKSRSQKKRDDKELMALGLKLASLEKEDLEKLPLSEELLYALQAYSDIKTHGARLRHEKYIGKLVRKEDPENLAFVAVFFKNLEGEKEEIRNRHQRLESMRDRLAAGDRELLDKLKALPFFEPDQLAFLADQAEKEARAEKTGGAKKALFRYLSKRLPEDF